MPDEIREHDEAFVEKAVAELSRHWDTVQVFVTRQESGAPTANTIGYSLGRGNWYARKGHVAEWLEGGAVDPPASQEESDG